MISSIVGLWKIFEKAGQKGWYILIPFYNFYIWLKIIKKPLWWYIFIIIPFINVFTLLLMVVEVDKCFKKNGLGAQALSVLFPFAYLPYLGFSNKEQYTHPDKLKVVKKSGYREWADAIIFAVIAATIIRTFFIEAYTIPTSSMEKTLLIGDFLFVSKINYGPKIPNTPLAFPFVHHTLPLTKDTKSYLEWINLPYYRFPGLQKIKNYDVVVFNYPDGDTLTKEFQSNESYYALVRKVAMQYAYNENGDFKKYTQDKAYKASVMQNAKEYVKQNFHVIARPVDKRENFIKRCIAIPGDSLKIVNKVIYLNGKAMPFPKESEFLYKVKTDGQLISNSVFKKYDITDGRRNLDGQPTPSQVFSTYFYFTDNSYQVSLTQSVAEKLKSVPGITGVEPMIQNQPDIDVFPYDTNVVKWNIDNYGSIWIPKKGATIALTEKNVIIYRRCIEIFEGNKFEVKGDKIFINGSPATTYTFKMDYYWMMGDNRHNSADSRYWGFVPEDHIVGKAMFVWLSLDPNRGLFEGKIRWSKMFRLVK